MVLKEDIRLALESQRGQVLLKAGTIPRKFLQKFQPSGNHIEVITGVRRCGKSTLMKQLIRDRYPGAAFFNFEDSRIHGFEVSDFPKLDELIDKDVDALFFDEIQNVPGWEIYIRQLHDQNRKVFLTGSNASLLGRELGTKLTGRHISHELFPFSFEEYLEFTNQAVSASTFDSFLLSGGFPEFLTSGNGEILQNLLKDIVYRDIAIRHGIRNTGILMDVTLYMLTNVGKEFSYNNLRKVFSLGSANTVSDYLSWLHDSYLLFFLPRFSYSAKNTQVNARKVYAIDNGLIRANTLSFTEDRGRLLENAAYMFLRGRFNSLFYFRENRECDFIVFENRACKMVIQVSETLDHDNEQREIEGLLEAMDYFHLSEGYILTRDQEDTLEVKGKVIHVKPLRIFKSQISPILN